MKEKCIIVDIDGTLSNADHRKYLVEKAPKDWDKFYEKMVEDMPNEWCTSILSWLNAAKATFTTVTPVVIIMTGRPDNYREATINWLKKYHIKYEMLMMREETDNREDFEVKLEQYRQFVKPKYDVLFVLEDRQQVVDAWRAEGLTCLQCAPGKF